MNKLILAFVFLVGLQSAHAQEEFPMPTASDYPRVAESGAKTSDFIPEGWKTLGEAKGDLNGDKVEDAALVLKGDDPKFINKNDSLGVKEFDTNPRMLVVLFGTKDGYRLAETSSSVIAIPNSPAMTEPFDSIAIKNRVLEIKQQIFMSAGGWTTSNYLYKFRYQGSEFVLIGADVGSTQRNTGETENRSYNFLTRKVKIDEGTIESDKTKSVTRKFKLDRQQTLKTFPKAFDWEVEKDFFI